MSFCRTQDSHAINPFTARVCNIFGLNDARMCLHTVYFPVLLHVCIFSVNMHFDGDPFTCQCEKEDKKAEGFQISLKAFKFRWRLSNFAEGFQISQFYGSFSNDILTVKGLSVITATATMTTARELLGRGCGGGWGRRGGEWGLEAMVVIYSKDENDADDGADNDDVDRPWR